VNARRADIPVPGLLSETDATQVEAAFGVGREQVERDHLISHMLALLAGYVRDDVVFIGGTALARTHLPALRLSEDIDLIARGPRSRIGRQIESALVADLARSFGHFYPGVRPDARLGAGTGFSPWTNPSSDSVARRGRPPALADRVSDD
jgi:hypothetical protein